MLFFVIRCAFWLTVVALALPWVVSQGHHNGHAVVATAAPPHPAATPGPIAATPVEAGCVKDIESCIESVAHVDMIALALQTAAPGLAPAERHVASPRADAPADAHRKPRRPAGTGGAAHPAPGRVAQNN